jgi:serine/threonine protein kinase
MAQPQARFQIPGCQVMDYLGKGARSTIWRVRERDRNRYYAVKRVTKQPGDDDRFFDQAINEFEIARQFDHPGLRKYYRLRRVRHWLQVNELHLFMELCDGKSCQAHRPADMARAVHIFHDVAGALTHLHALGFVHGDIKPNNIIVADDDTAKIIDFGQSCPIGTVKDRIQGTPDFIAPEQVRRHPLDGRTDVFNFGAALYWVLTGKAIPTILPKDTASVQLVSDLAVTPPVELNDQVPAPLNRLVLDCIEFNASRRPQAIKEVASRLDLIAHRIDNGNGDPASPPAEPAGDDLDTELDDFFHHTDEGEAGPPLGIAE